MATFASTQETSGGADHDAIQTPVEELACADPRDGARVQALMYRLHAAIAGHFGEAEMILAKAGMEEQAQRHASSAPAGRGRATERNDRDHAGPSTWFG
jgi:hypothetical protein